MKYYTYISSYESVTFPQSEIITKWIEIIVLFSMKFKAKLLSVYMNPMQPFLWSLCAIIQVGQYERQGESSSVWC